MSERGGRGGLALVSEGCFQVLSCPTLPGGSSGGGGGGSGGGGRDNGDNSCGDGLKWSTRRWAGAGHGRGCGGASGAGVSAQFSMRLCKALHREWTQNPVAHREPSQNLGGGRPFLWRPRI